LTSDHVEASPAYRGLQVARYLSVRRARQIQEWIDNLRTLFPLPMLTSD